MKRVNKTQRWTKQQYDNTCHFPFVFSKVFTFQVIEPSLKKTKIYIHGKLKYLPVLAC